MQSLKRDAGKGSNLQEVIGACLTIFNTSSEVTFQNSVNRVVQLSGISTEIEE